MAQISLIAQNYAKALFGASKQSNNLDKISEDLEVFKKNFNHDFATELANPAISKADAVKIIIEIGKKLELSDSKLLINFIESIAQNRRLALFSQICTGFSQLVKEEKNILEVEIISSADLETSTIEDIKNVIKKKYPNKTIEVKKTLKDNILGGLQIKIGSNLIDASLKNKLSLIKKELIAVAN